MIAAFTLNDTLPENLQGLTMTDSTRRQFMTTAGALAAAAALPASAQAASSDCPLDAPVLHMVYFWLANPDSAEDKAKLIKGLKSLQAIPQVQALHVGVPASTLKRDVIDNSFHVSELMMFNSVEDQDAYQTHPVHLKFVEECEHLWERVVVRDSLSA